MADDDPTLLPSLRSRWKAWLVRGDWLLLLPPSPLRAKLAAWQLDRSIARIDRVRMQGEASVEASRQAVARLQDLLERERAKASKP